VWWSCHWKAKTPERYSTPRLAHGSSVLVQVGVTDTLSQSGPTAPSAEAFSRVDGAGYGEVLWGVSITPGTTP
jgi:hypothetical protein